MRKGRPALFNDLVSYPLKAFPASRSSYVWCRLSHGRKGSRRIASVHTALRRRSAPLSLPVPVVQLSGAYGVWSLEGACSKSNVTDRQLLSRHCRYARISALTVYTDGRKAARVGVYDCRAVPRPMLGRGPT